MATPLTHAPAAATAAVITIAANAGVVHELEQVSWSYDTTPTGGSLKIESPSGTILQQWLISAAGPGFMPFSGSCLRGAVSQALIVTLASGAGSVVGTVNALKR